jgi:CBS domain-containing protein
MSDDLVRKAPRLLDSDTVEHAVRLMLDSRLPALPVEESSGRLSGIFGEREFMSALFPGYVGELGFAGFVPRTLDSAMERRAGCAAESVGAHMNVEHVQVGPEFSDLEVAEIFLHHRVLVVPVAERGRLIGVITRADFFKRLAQRFLAAA